MVINLYKKEETWHSACLLGFSRETEAIGDMYTSTYELAHSVMEAEKVRDLPSASWRNRKTCGIILFKSKGPRTRSAHV